MKIHTVLKRAGLKRAVAASLLSATIAAPAVLGLTAFTANARPIESPNCRAIAQAVDSSIHMDTVAQGTGISETLPALTRITTESAFRTVAPGGVYFPPGPDLQLVVH